ncbi:S8 family serine peptidase [Massilia pseudoviolaceinigra]|uniref:S8 family serine peptidase n=1 Tax=Massilia pseudoviolaceinigra TaxID=3057165 RepID=UPI00279652B6|nr:S8 family serine peptidase [Massilia sp. CCM 9206]MDQ1924088.1 S8 family serine peptidase [Massilia sp. CCM 9206]
MKHSQSKYPSFLKFCVAAVITAGPVFAHASVGDLDLTAKSQPVSTTTDRMIVKYKSSGPVVPGAALMAGASQARLAVVQRSGQQFGLTMKALHTTANGAQILKLDKKMDVKDVAAIAKDLMERDTTIEYAEPDRMMEPLFAPNDPMYFEQWHYGDTTGGLRLPAAWDIATGSGVVVAVIDTGFRPHADLAGQFLPGYDFVTDLATANDGDGRDSDARDPGNAVAAGECGVGKPQRNSNWHGTHVAGTIAAKTNNGLGVAGVAFNAKVLPLRVLGKCGGYTSDIADAITWASGGAVSGVPANANKAKVLNLSLGGPGACDTTTQDAINAARSRGSVVIVAAGNSNTNVSGFSPANCSGVIAIAATKKDGGRASYSNYGSLIDVAAPGGDTGGLILSTLNAGTNAPGADSYANSAGTSMAAPHVAGVAALMLSKNSALTPDDIEAKLKSTVRTFPAPCTSCGTGIVDALAAVKSVTGDTTPPAGTTINETETNNAHTSANAVTVSGTVVKGNMGTDTDSDYFAVQLPAGKTLTATMTIGSSSADYDLYAYSSNGTTEVAMSENGAGVADSLSTTNTGTTTTTRYVRVKYYSGGIGASSGAYSLKLSW